MEPDSYIVEKSYGDILFNAAVYKSSGGVFFVRKSCVVDLPKDITDADLDPLEWIEMVMTS